MSSLGDILLSTPMIRSIKKRYPHISIDFLLKKEYKEALLYNPYISNLLFYSKEKDEIELIKKRVKSGGYNLIIDLQNNFRSKSISDEVSCQTVRFHKKSIDKFLLVNFKVNRLKNAGSIPERYASTIPRFLLDEGGLEIFFKNHEPDTQEYECNIIGFCPGSRHFTKMWPKEYYIEAGKILSESGKRIYLIGGKSDRAVCREIASAIPGATDCSNDDSLLETALQIKKCEAVICNDSGLMHLACAVKTPVIVLFGSTVKEFGFFPYHNKNLILENNSLTCRPCSHIGRDKCPKGHFKCMNDITPLIVCEKLELLLKL